MKPVASIADLKTGFLLAFLFSPEDGGDMFVRFNFTRLYSCMS
jgi:hypothetical protein